MCKLGFSGVLRSRGRFCNIARGGGGGGLHRRGERTGPHWRNGERRGRLGRQRRCRLGDGDGWLCPFAAPRRRALAHDGWSRSVRRIRLCFWRRRNRGNRLQFHWRRIGSRDSYHRGLAPQGRQAASATCRVLHDLLLQRESPEVPPAANDGRLLICSGLG